MNNKLTAIATFLRVAEAGSFSAAARQIGMKQSAVSQQIAALEQELGVVLLHRTTRAMMLTEQGEHYRRDMQRVLNAMQEAERRLTRRSLSFRDECMSSCQAVSAVFCCRISLALQKQYPELHLMLSLDDRIADLVTEGVDVALRLGHEPPPSHAARVLARIETALFAAPGHYAVQSVDDLAEYPHVRFSGLPLDAPLRIISADETETCRLRPFFGPTPAMRCCRRWNPVSASEGCSDRWRPGPSGLEGWCRSWLTGDYRTVSCMPSIPMPVLFRRGSEA